MMWIPVIVCGVCLIFYGGFLLWTAYYFITLRPVDEQGNLPSITVIIPARNEEQNISRCLGDIAAQDYPAALRECIVVDDHSTDNTHAVASAFAEKYPWIQMMRAPVPGGNAFKKAAVAAAIEAARGEVILTTDADCRMNPLWMKSMAAQFDAQTGLVSGPVLGESHTLFGHFQSLEFMGLIAVGAGSIAGGAPNMCNGANLAYRKEAYRASGGFTGVDHIASGDDEFLMHRIAANGTYKVRFAKVENAIVRTPVSPTMRAFAAQRKRWVSKSTRYEKSSITAILVACYTGMLTFPLLTVYSILDATWWPLLAAAFGWKVLCELTVLWPAARFFRKLHLLSYLLIEQFLHIPYILWIGIAGNTGSYQWKGRKAN